MEHKTTVEKHLVYDRIFELCNIPSIPCRYLEITQHSANTWQTVDRHVWWEEITWCQL